MQILERKFILEFSYAALVSRRLFHLLACYKAKFFFQSNVNLQEVIIVVHS